MTTHRPRALAPSSITPRRDGARTGRRRLGVLAGLTLAMVLALVGGAVSPAWAHAILERANPAGGTAAATAPSSITLGFSEAVRADADSIRVINTQGDRVDTSGAHGGPTDSDVTISLKPGLPVGTYLVSWHVISADSHPVSGGYAFGIGQPPSADAAAAAGRTQGAPASVSFLYSVARFLSFGGLALVIGAMFFLAALWPAGLARSGPRRLVLGGWAAAFVGALLSLLLQGPYGAGLGLSALGRWDPLGATLADRFGKLTLLRMLVLLLAVPLLAGAFRAAAGGRRPSPWRGGELGVLAVAAMATTALAGHAGVGSIGWLSSASVTVHLLAMAVWLGGLAVLAVSLLRRSTAPAVSEDEWAARGGGDTDDDDALAAAHAYLRASGADAEPVAADRASELAGVLPRWSRTAMAAVAAIVVSGVYQAWREVGAVGALFDTGYGRLLLYKLWFVVAMLAVAFLSQRWVTRHYRPVARAMTADAEASLNAAGAAPGAEGQDDDEFDDEFDESGRRKVTGGSLAALRRGVVAEAAISLVVLAVTAVLVSRPPGRTDYAPPLHSTTTAGPLTVDVRVAPTRIGLENIDIVVKGPQGQPQRLVQASVTLSLPAAEVGPIDVPMTPSGTGVLRAQNAQVPLAGDWEMVVTLRINDFDEYSTTVDYRVH